MPLLGQLQGISHGLQATPNAVAALAVDSQIEDAPAPNSLTSLFGTHTGADCQWFAHLALGAGLLGAPACSAIHVQPPFAAPSLYALLLSQSPALFFARGPPC